MSALIPNPAKPHSDLLAQAGVAVPDGFQPTTPALGPAPTQPPNPVLSSLAGRPVTVPEFNQRLEAVTAQHQQSFGVKPSPAAALQAVFSPASEPFTPQVPPTAAQAALALHPVVADGDFLRQFEDVAANAGTDRDAYNQFLHDNEARIQGMQKTRATAIKVNAIVNRAQVAQFGAPKSGTEIGQSAGLAKADLGSEAGSVLSHAVGQIVDSLIHSPGGLYVAGRAMTLDARDAAVHPLRKDEHSRTFDLGGAAAHQVKEDFSHPERNAGYLFLDILGAASVGAGAAARVAEAGRVARAGEGAASAARALVTKPALQTFPVRVGDYAENMPLSANPFVAAIQKRVLQSRQDAADTRLIAGPSPLRSIIMPEWAEQEIAFERKVGRETNARMRVEHTAAMALANELRAAAGASVSQSRVFSRLSGDVTRGLSRGEQKAIQVQSWDDPNPLEAERHFHESMIEQGIGSAKAHRRQLADLTLAENALKNPSARLSRALELTREVVAEQQRLKIEELGLAPETAEGRVVRTGTVLREDSASAATAKLERLEAQHQAATDKLADAMFGPIDRAEVGRRSLRNAKAARQEAGVDRSGRATGASAAKQRALPTVKAERRRLVERRVEDEIAKNPNDPTLRRWAARAAEIDRLREGLMPFPGEPSPFLSAEELAALERQNPDAFYLPTQPVGTVKRPPSQRRGTFGVSAGPYGVPVGREMPELTHEFTGDALRAGNIRIDATNLAAEAYARTVRAVTVKSQWNDLWKAATPKKRSDFDIPIRDQNTISGKLREIVAKLDEGTFTKAEADLLPQDAADLLRALYPPERDLTPEEIPHVRWIDSRLLGDALKVPHVAGLGAKAANFVNAPFRFLALHARPAYVLNKFGNHAMLIFDQGFLNSGTNLARAMALKATDGERNASTIRELVGAGKSRGYVTSSSGRISQGLAEFWNRVADRDERVASFLYYSDRKGYRTPEQRDALLTDKANAADLVEVTRRSNKALVEFDNMLPVEKNYLRHLVFVYPWVRGSAVWSLRAIMEHPAKVDLLAQLGRDEIKNDPLLDKAAEWYRRIGYFPVGWNGANQPMVVNPTSVNTFSTLGDFLNVGRGATVGDQTASLSDLFGPAAQFGVHAALGRDEYGNKYPGSQFWGAAKEVLAGLPQLTHALKPAASGKAVAPVDIRKRASLQAHLNSLIHQTVFGPGWLDGYGSLITGGFTEKPLDPAALQARGEHEEPAAQRVARELKLLNYMLSRQGEFLGQPVPDAVRRSVRDNANITLKVAEFHKATGRTPTAKERTGIALTYLADKGRIPDAQAAKLERQLSGLQDDEISTFRTALLNEYAAGKELRQWDRDVRTLYSFKKDTFNEKAAALHAQGLSPQSAYDVPQATLDEYGRGFLKFQAQVRAAHQRKESAADLRLITDEHAEPVHGLPSYAAIAWANQTPAEQQHAILRDATAGWGTLTSIEKRLVGKPVGPRLSLAWAAYDHNVKSLAAQLPPGQRSLDAGQRLGVAKQMDQAYKLAGAFTSDYLFALKPLYERLPYLRLVQRSPHRSEWLSLFAEAKRFQAAIDYGYSASAAKDAWDDYASQLPAALEKSFPGFWAELKPIVAADPSLLKSLFEPERTPANA